MLLKTALFLAPLLSAFANAQDSSTMDASGLSNRPNVKPDIGPLWPPLAVPIMIVAVILFFTNVYLVAIISLKKPKASTLYSRYLAKANRHWSKGNRLRSVNQNKQAIIEFDRASEACTFAALIYDRTTIGAHAAAVQNRATYDEPIQQAEANRLALNAYKSVVKMRKETVSIVFSSRNSLNMAESHRSVAEAFRKCAAIYHAMGDFQSEITAYEFASVIYSVMADYIGEAETLELTATAYRAQGDRLNMIKSYCISAKAYRAANRPIKEIEIHMILMTQYAYTYKYVDLGHTAMRLAQLYHAAGNYTHEAKACHQAIKAFGTLYHMKQVMTAYRQAIAAYQAANDPHGLSEISTLTANIARAANDPSSEIAAMMVAAESFLVCQAYRQSAESYERAATIHRHFNAYVPASQCYEFAENAYRGAGDESAAERMQQALDACEPTPRLLCLSAQAIILKHRESLQKTLFVTVRRSMLLTDSYNSIMALTPEQMHNTKLWIRFQDELAEDYGGVSREWFFLLSKEMTSAKTAFFVSRSSLSRTYQLNPCKTSKKDLAYFEFFGRVIALALSSAHLIPFRLATSMLKQMLGLEPSFDDLHNLDPSLHTQLKELQTLPNVSELALYFTLQMAPTKIVELSQGGATRLVTNRNVQEYVTRATRMYLKKSVKHQLAAFLAGFHSAMHRPGLNSLMPRALEFLLNGEPVVSIEDWQRYTVYNEYDKDSNIIGWFWHIVSSFSTEQRAKLLQFVTASPHLPMEGFSALHPKFTIAKIHQGAEYMPSAVTCFHQLRLPDYPSESILKEKLVYAMNEANLGFEFI